MNLPNELMHLILSSLSTRDVLVFSSVCKDTHLYTSKLTNSFWLDRISISLFDIEDQPSTILQKVSTIYDCESLWSIKDVNILPLIYANFNYSRKLKLIYKYDNDVLLEDYISKYIDVDIELRDIIRFGYNYLAKYPFSKRCLCFLKKIALTKDVNINEGKQCIVDMFSYSPDKVCDFLKFTWENIETTACSFASVFYTCKLCDLKYFMDTMLYLLEFQSLFNCNTYEQIAILLFSASNDLLWNRLIQTHPSLPWKYNELLDSKGYGEWYIIRKTIYFKQSCQKNIIIICERLKGIISNVHIQGLMD